MTNKTHTTDVTIIGAGPVGLFAIFECGMLGMQCHVIDALDMIGGQCMALYPEKPIYDIPAHPEIDGQDLIKNLERQAFPFSPTYHLGQQAISLTKNGDEFEIVTSLGEKIASKAVIIAAGVGAFGPNRPPLENLAEYEGKSLHYMVKRRDEFQGKKVVIGGGGDSALDWAISLSDITDKLYIVHRRDKFRGAPDSVNQLQKRHKAGKLEIVTPYQLASLEGENGQLSAVTVKTLKGEERRLEADTLLAFYGLSMKLGPIAEWGLNLENKNITINPTTAETSAPGIFAIGDVATYPNKLKLILSGFAEAATAAHGARQLCFPGEDFHFEYSTTKGVPGEEANDPVVKKNL